MDTQFVFGTIFGAIIGFLVSLVANEVTARIQASRATAAITRKYEGIVGEYIAFAFAPDSEELNFDKPSGECRITYEGDHVLKLHYEEVGHDHVWEAEIWMVSPFTGSMVWRYVRLFGNEPIPIHRFGFKRCAVCERPGRSGEMRKFFVTVHWGKWPISQRFSRLTPVWKGLFDQKSPHKVENPCVLCGFDW